MEVEISLHSFLETDGQPHTPGLDVSEKSLAPTGI